MDLTTLALAMNLIAAVADLAELRHGLQRMPPAEIVTANLAFNVAYRGHLARELEVTHWDTDQANWLLAADRESYWAWWQWDCLACGQRGSLFWLARLREGIGPCAYREGLMPPHVPLWRFHRID